MTRDEIIAQALIVSMTEEQKEHFYGLIQSYDKAVKSFCEGRVTTIPCIEIRFIQTGYVDLQNSAQAGIQS